jgi:hypothetical protein
MVKEMKNEELAEFQEEADIFWLMSLVPLGGAGFEVTPLPPLKVNGEDANGIKVSCKGHEDARLYFSEPTGLLVKIERRARESGVQVDKEYVFSSFKIFDGVQLPTRTLELTNGKTQADVTTTSYRFLDRVDAGAFARP